VIKRWLLVSDLDENGTQTRRRSRTIEGRRKERMTGTDPRVMATRLCRNPLHDTGYMGDSRHKCLMAIERVIDADRGNDRSNLCSWAWSIRLLLRGYWTSQAQRVDIAKTCGSRKMQRGERVSQKANTGQASQYEPRLG